MRSDLRVRVALPLIAALALAACTTPRAGDYKVAEADKWEKTNRKIYAINKDIDRYGLRPAAKVYRTVVPTAARRGINNVFSNYGEPLNFVNAVLQGKISQAFRTVDRFLINTTIGIGGLADHATELGRPQESEDYGQTLAVWGVPSGPFLMLPLFGPSTVRDGAGTALEFAADPATIARNAVSNPTIFWSLGQTAVQIVNLRDRISEQGGDDVLAASLDEYTLVKSAYLQRRRDQIWDGNVPSEDDELPPDDAVPDAPPAAAATTATPPVPADPPVPPQ